MNQREQSVEAHLLDLQSNATLEELQESTNRLSGWVEDVHGCVHLLRFLKHPVPSCWSWFVYWWFKAPNHVNIINFIMFFSVWLKKTLFQRFGTKDVKPFRTHPSPCLLTTAGFRVLASFPSSHLKLSNNLKYDILLPLLPLTVRQRASQSYRSCVCDNSHHSWPSHRLLQDRKGTLTKAAEVFMRKQQVTFCRDSDCHHAATISLQKLYCRCLRAWLTAMAVSPTQMSGDIRRPVWTNHCSLQVLANRIQYNHR